jgi:hypothetical protein
MLPEERVALVAVVVRAVQTRRALDERHAEMVAAKVREAIFGK